MADTKVTILDALVAALLALTGVTTATRNLLKPVEQRASAPYVGVLAGEEEVLVEDSTHLRYLLRVDLILIKFGDDIEGLITEIKNAIYTPISIGALDVHLIRTGEVTLVFADAYSSCRMELEVTYAAAKAGF